MDNASKEQFRWRFWYLAVMLNGVILFFALSVIAIFLFPESFRIPGAIICLVIAIILTVIFKKNYHKTKAWLDINA